MVAADVAPVLSEHLPFYAISNAKTCTGFSAGLAQWIPWYIDPLAEGKSLTLYSNAQKAKTTIARWRLFLHLPKAKEAGSAAT